LGGRIQPLIIIWTNDIKGVLSKVALYVKADIATIDASLVQPDTINCNRNKQKVINLSNVIILRLFKILRCYSYLRSPFDLYTWFAICLHSLELYIIGKFAVYGVVYIC